jgi:hypothetical protein
VTANRPVNKEYLRFRNAGIINFMGSFEYNDSVLSGFIWLPGCCCVSPSANRDVCRTFHRHVAREFGKTYKKSRRKNFPRMFPMERLQPLSAESGRAGRFVISPTAGLQFFKML